MMRPESSCANLNRRQPTGDRHVILSSWHMWSSVLFSGKSASYLPVTHGFWKELCACCFQYSFIYYLIYAYGYFACMFVCKLCVCSAHRGQKGVWDLLELGLQDGCSPACGLWESSLDPVEGQPVLLTTELSLQPPNCPLLWHDFY